MLIAIIMVNSFHKIVNVAYVGGLSVKVAVLFLIDASATALPCCKILNR